MELAPGRRGRQGEHGAAGVLRAPPPNVRVQVTGTFAIGSSPSGRMETGWKDIAERVVSHLDTSIEGQFFTPRFVRADVLAARAWAGRRLEVPAHPLTLPQKAPLPRTPPLSHLLAVC